VDIFRNDGGVKIVDDNVDECILCRLCIDASPAGTVRVHKLYSGETLD
jgi:NAD-dependent dihydropyrimidine dehydrogenase PreA subunit